MSFFCHLKVESENLLVWLALFAKNLVKFCNDLKGLGKLISL